MDTEQIAANNIDLSEEDLNMFLRSWQEGKTNQGLRVCKLTVDFFDVRKVLKDCGGQLMDPRTTKLKFPKLGKYGFIDDVWIRGGIHIRRNDGRLAVIQTNNYVYWREGEGAREEDVKEYLRNLEIWNSENRRFVRERVFNFYIF
uniref:FBA_2 domain-containing protein n=1 Tax=Caenorhabditis tropicalis TaxID=1561998 RepID=A0A1I7T4P6_9PELO